MDIKTAITQRRTIRRFQNKAIDEQVLRNIIALSRLYASGANMQPIRYIAVTNQNRLDSVFATLRWAAYLPEFRIEYDSRPMAYIILTSDKSNCQFDLGAAATTLMLAAEGEGLATCCLGSFDRSKLRKILLMKDGQEPLLVVALGYPAQTSRIVEYNSWSPF